MDNIKMELSVTMGGAWTTSGLLCSSRLQNQVLLQSVMDYKSNLPVAKSFFTFQRI